MCICHVYQAMGDLCAVDTKRQIYFYLGTIYQCKKHEDKYRAPGHYSAKHICIVLATLVCALL